MKQRVMIIGGGITGLVAGCYGQINGFDTEIFEMHDLPGGFCTSWQRRGYTFDGCIHWLMGVKPGTPLHEGWKRVGAFDGIEFYQHEIVEQIEGSEGKKLTLYSNVDRLEAHLLELSPADTQFIKEFADAVRNRSDWERMVTNTVNDKFNAMTGQQFIEQFQDPFLREAFTTAIAGGHLPFFLLRMAVYNAKEAAWPIGGSLKFAQGIAAKYQALGGKLHYRSKVERILVQDSRAAGIQLSDGQVWEADYVVAAADGFATVFNLLNGEYLNDEIKQLYEEASIVPAGVQVSLGVDYDLAGEPDYLRVKLNPPLKLGGRDNTYLNLRHYGYDPTLCPPGKSVVISLLASDYGYWEELNRNPQAYHDAKQQIAAKVIEVLEQRFPAAKGKVEVVDVATPLTFHRYTDSWQGGYMGWKNPSYPIPQALPGVQGLVLAGQWTSRMSGLPTALMTGQGSIRRICIEAGREFIG